MKRDKEKIKEYRRKDDDYYDRRQNQRPEESQKYKKPWDRENYYSRHDDYDYEE